jgi:hypothetical protein
VNQDAKGTLPEYMLFVASIGRRRNGGIGWMSTFDKREEAFERKFAHDEELRFRAGARRDALLARWAAEKLGKAGAAAELYVTELLSADVRAGGYDGVFRKLRKDLDAASVTVSNHQIEAKMDEFMAEAMAELRRTG